MSRDMDGYNLFCAMLLLSAEQSNQMKEAECACTHYLNDVPVVHLPDLNQQNF